jgi:pimeloyl-ACP methyl ester carboxylesterase
MRPLLALAALLLLGCPSVARLPHLLEPLPSEAEGMRIKTSDGWELVLIRYRAQGEKRGLPVLLVHGIGANGRNMDLDAEHSLARWMSARGREAFVLNLRGTGRSDAPAPERGRPFGYSMDTYAGQDLPAAFAAVREVTGARQVDYVGHSMGGLVLYIYLARGGQDVNAAATLGSPARLNWGGNVERVAQVVAPFVPPFKQVPLTNVTALGYPLYWQVNPPLDLIFYNPENISDRTWDKLMAVGASNFYGGVVNHFGLWIQRDGMLSADGRIDYLEAMRKRTSPPLFVVAGKTDRLGPVQAVRAGFDAWGGPKQWFIAGEENGLEHDYGHMDLVIGDNAPRELWPRVLSFLDRHAPAAR